MNSARTLERDKGSEAALLRPSELDIVQFSTQIYFADEDEGTVSVGLMRLGSAVGEARVSYFTMEGSAKAGDQFEHQSGEVVFAHGEKDKTIEIGLIDDDKWHATNEFKLMLSDPTNCILSHKLHTARVKVLDNNTFPSDKYAEAVQGGQESIWKISGLGLFWEYFQLNIQQEGLALRTALIVILDQMHNVQLLLQTWMSMYMVDVVFNTGDPDSDKRLRFFHTRLSEALLMAALNVIPIGFLHLWEYARIKLDVEGLSTAFLRANLIRRYMNLSEESRAEVDGSRVQVAFMDETVSLSRGYCAVLEVVKGMGTVSVLVIFTVHSNPGAWWVVVTLPLFMSVFLVLRISCFPEVEDTVEAKKSMLGLISQMLKNYKLIAGYYQRPKINEMVGKKVNHLRDKSIPVEVASKHDEYLPNWVGGLFVAAYMAIEAPNVLVRTEGAGGTSLGTFLATISIIRDVAGSFSILYSVYLKLMETVDPVRDITWLFALKTDLKMWKAVNRRRRQMSLEARSKETYALAEAGDRDLVGAFSDDRLKIMLEKVSFHYLSHEPVLCNVSLTVPQGALVAVRGAHGSGKRTMLEILGHSIFPVRGHVFVPGHLQILQVEQNSMLFESWSALHNLTFGISHSDINPKVIRKVLTELQMERTWRLVEADLSRSTDDGQESADSDSSSSVVSEVPAMGRQWASVHLHIADEKADVNWHESLSATEKSKLCLARALIANPEVLILHKPFQNYEEEGKHVVMQALLTHVQNRGMGAPVSELRCRRKRTCFYSVLDPKDTLIADVVWMIDPSERAVLVERDVSTHLTWWPIALASNGLLVMVKYLRIRRAASSGISERLSVVREASREAMSRRGQMAQAGPQRSREATGESAKDSQVLGSLRESQEQESQGGASRRESQEVAVHIDRGESPPEDRRSTSTNKTDRRSSKILADGW